MGGCNFCPLEDSGFYQIVGLICKIILGENHQIYVIYKIVAKLFSLKLAFLLTSTNTYGEDKGFSYIIQNQKHYLLINFISYKNNKRD